ncbi:DUF6185 family protein [Streptomyces sp. NPDC052396]|uniref:DUF6185 family protein n=1 Tax=Streptomyces sp. NPDC052396 TaxID=3365689 RepID=UPI0037D74244
MTTTVPRAVQGPTHGSGRRGASDLMRRGGRAPVLAGLLLLLLGLAWWAPGSARAAASAVEDCHTGRLAAARAEAELHLDNHAHSVARAASTLTIRTPVNWPYASDLLLSARSPDYQRAMRCLLRGPRVALRTDEWREQSPRVTAEGSWVKVRYDTLFWFRQGGQYPFGPWTADVRGDYWSLSLTPAPALGGAHWDRVQIDLGGLDATKVTPRPSKDIAGQLIWEPLTHSRGPGQPVRVQLIPPWQRVWTVTSSSSESWLLTNAAGMTTWWVGGSAVVVFAALRARRQPVGLEATPLELSSSTALLRWGVLKAALGVLVLLLYKAVLDLTKAMTAAPDWLEYTFRWPILLGVLVGWALVWTARPRRPVLLAASLVAVTGGLVAAVPGLFGLPPQLAAPQGPFDITALALLAMALLWLWLMGLMQWGWLLAHDGGLLRAPAAPWRLRGAGAWLAAIALLYLGWALWAVQRAWKRVSWLSDQGVPAYHTQYLAFVSRSLASFAYQLPTWFYAHTWVLTGIGIVAVVRARDLALRVPYASPTPLDRLLLAVFFALVVAWRQGAYAGSQLLAVIWLVLDIAALYGLLAVGQRRAVLTLHFEGAHGNPALSESITDAGREILIARARRYRELICLLHGTDQTHAEGAAGRHALEKELSRLHRWRPAGGGGAAGATRAWLPNEVTVVDVALSWGPHAKWWDNARRAAVLAAGFGLPASLIFVWLSYSPADVWMRQEQYFFGLPDMLWTFVSWELTWAGAGLVLGALWRLLPGRRGPARALSLVAAYALLIGLGILGNLLTDQGIGNVAIGISLMLLVLTLTSLAMDADTFRSERRFWPNRVGLLLSIYQIRSFSAQIAYILVQLVAVLTVLKFFSEPNLRGLKP